MKPYSKSEIWMMIRHQLIMSKIHVDGIPLTLEDDENVLPIISVQVEYFKLVDKVQNPTVKALLNTQVQLDSLIERRIKETLPNIIDRIQNHEILV